MTIGWMKWIGAGLGLLGGLGLGPLSATAADRIVLTYGSLAMEIPIAELDTLATTGEVSEDLSQLLGLANQEPAALQKVLLEPVSVNPTVLNIALNTPAGERLLDLVGESIQPLSGVDGRSALRAAILASAADGELSLLEVLRVYPSPDIVVQGDRLISAYGEVLEAIGPWLRILTLGQF
ncbi:alpha/beta hydrolase [Leptolyngbya sp. PCC 6406]|uniref:alpha/beta hydrolase n=1 Tax=Leptolyngbya sp. PCC 6406 TaxID=1173264 RepID=UPI0002AC181A|nr:alpha/beta hydrolase [Leptolyngbya sp. PCC 6406]